MLGVERWTLNGRPIRPKDLGPLQRALWAGYPPRVPEEGSLPRTPAIDGLADFEYNGAASVREAILNPPKGRR